jgi:peptide/nickel transport system permease protein
MVLGRHVLLNLVSPPVPEWGAMVSTARQYIVTAPHTFVYPTLAIFVTDIAFNLLGDALRDTFDPTLKD